MKFAIKIFLIGITFIFTGCVTLYKPNAIHSPLIKEKGDLNASASIGASGCGLYNLQAAYAISNNIGIMIDGMHHRRRLSSADSSVEKLEMFFGEAGAGYFTRFGNNKNGLFQCYSGAGYGVSKDRVTSLHRDPNEMNAKYFNVFIQPGVAFTGKNFEMAFDLRANYVNLFNIRSPLYDKFEWWNTDFRFHSDTSLYFINLEPTLTMKAGGQKLKGIVQFGLTIPSINAHSYFIVNTSSLLGIPLIKFSLGINYYFGKFTRDSFIALPP